MNDYERIALVIRSVDERRAEPPDLAALAECAGLSQSAFHRLLLAWAGVSPKDFLQCLTISHAKELLQRGEKVLNEALIPRPSSPARFQNLDIILETASPGGLHSGPEAETISAGFAGSPFGGCLVGESPRGICHLSFIDSQDGRAEWEELQKNWPRARLQRDDSTASRIAGRIFARPGQARSLPTLRAFLQGTPFQLQVWWALLHVPPGALVSYGHLASALGKPKAARAVGTAVGQNPLTCLVPCHRVIRATGEMGDYHWGRVRKRAIVAWENAQLSTTQELFG